MTRHRQTGAAECAAAREDRRTVSRVPRHRGDDLHALLSGAARGESRAWEALVARYGATIRAVARRHRLTAADQDEVAQRTWLRLVQHVASVKEPAALGGWLATTARRESLRVLAASRREVPVDEPPNADEADPSSIEDAASAAERRDALHRALAALPARQGTLMRFLLTEPAVSYDEVSIALGMPRGSIGPTYGRCVARLRRDPHLARALGACPIPADGHAGSRR
jgi:RNA polymerase sigma factor (sigma-70 family)